MFGSFYNIGWVNSFIGRYKYKGFDFSIYSCFSCVVGIKYVIMYFFNYIMFN